MSQNSSADVIVVGGGLAGLTAAAFAARTGKSVALFERARDVGGRAATQNEGGFLFNMGPHALYNAGEARPILDELGVARRGRSPAVNGGFAVLGGRKHTLPGGPLALLTTSLLSLTAKLELARLMGGLPRLDPEPLHSTTLNDWLSATVRNETVRDLVRALVRLATYTNAADRISAGTAIRQLQLALGKGVTYLDGGWQTLVDGLRHAAEQAGVRVVVGAKVESVDADGAARGVRLADGSSWQAGAVILTGGPAEISSAVHRGTHPPLRDLAAGAVPVRAACLDLGLSCLPKPAATFAIGIDQPLYLSVHSAAAKLGPENTATVQVAKYLPPGKDGDARADERELEAIMDLIQPGWRDVVLQRRYLPRMVVSHCIATAAAGGIAGRPDVDAAGIANLYIAGDWIGAAGLLADATLASAKRAARLAGGSRTLHAAA